MSNSLSNEAFINYEKALSIGKKEGKTPLVLDNILKEITKDFKKDEGENV